MKNVLLWALLMLIHRNGYVLAEYEEELLDASCNTTAEGDFTLCLIGDLDGSCPYRCSLADACSLGWELEKLSYKNTDCREFGFSVELGPSVRFSNSTIRANWFTGNVSLNELVIDVKEIHTIEGHAFEADAFRTITKLTLNNLRITIFNNDTFIGLDSLISLKLYSVESRGFTAGFLSGISDSLQSFVLFGRHSADVVNVNGLTGGIKMPVIKWVTFSMNLSNSISSDTFTGLLSVETLELSECDIDVIGENAFNCVRDTLKLLKLDGNNLKRLPVSIFWALLPNSDLIIYMTENPWNCECHLQEFQNNLKWNRENFIGVPKCATPMSVSNVDVEFVELRDDTEIDWTNDDVVSRKCFDRSSYSFREIRIKKSNHFFQITRNHKRSVSAIVEMNSSYFTLFLQNFKDQSSCLTKIPKYFLIKELVTNMVYSFCLIKSKDSTISPFNCISYYHGFPLHDIWLFNSSKGVYIPVFLCCLLLCLVLGTVIGYICFKNNSTCLSSNVKTILNSTRTNSCTDDLSYEEKLQYIARARSYSDLSTIAERKYETAVNPSRFEIILKRLEDEKYIYSEKPYYTDRIPNVPPPELPQSVSRYDDEFNYFNLEQHRL